MQDRDIFSRNKISMAVALALASYGSAQAQEASSSGDAMDSEREVIEEVVTTGIRRSLEDSAAIKMDNESIVEAISAEEIGKLPDVSIAESLARLPGLTAQRLNGRGQVISVRGLSPDFTTALLNGREQVSAGDNRGVEFDQYPSEVLSGVVVYKTPDAALTGQGLAGTADLQVVRPLDHGEQTIAANIRYQWLEYSGRGGDDKGVRYSGTYIDQFADDTVGVVLAVADMSSPTQADWFEAWGYPSDPGALVIGGGKAWVQASELDRTGVVGVLEYEPSDTFHATVDMFYSKFDESLRYTGLEVPLWWSSASLQPGFTVENGLVTEGTFTGVKPVGRNDANFRQSDLRSVGFNATWAVDDNWSVEADANYSNINRTDQILETYVGTGSGVTGEGATDTMDFTMLESGISFNAGLDYADPNLMVLTDPQGWGGTRRGDGGQAGFNKFFTVDDTIEQLRLSAMGDVEWGFISNLEYGLKVSQRRKLMDNDEEIITTAGGTYDPVADQVTGNPSSVSLGSTGVAIGAADLSYAGIPGVVSYDAVAMYNSNAYFKVPFVHRDVTVKSWDIQEDVTTAYAKFGFDSTWGNKPVSGNFGLQLMHTDQLGISKSGIGEFSSLQEVAVQGGRSYYDLLPSFNVTIELTDDSFFRIAGARTLARPRMDDLRPGLVFSFNSNKPCASQAASDADATSGGDGCTLSDLEESPWGGGGGNPELDPWIANAFDISYEKYFEDRAGYLAIAAFYKDLETYIYNQTVPFNFTGYPSDVTPLTTTGLASTPQNGEGGSIQGLEFALSLPGGMVHDSLDGFGAFLTYSYTDSEIESNGPGSATPLPGLSEQVGNLTLYFERDGFSARVSGRYRSDFLGEVSGFAAGRTLRTVESETIVDAQVSYMFQSGPLDGVNVLLQGYNLTDEPFKTFDNDDPRQVRNYQQYGRSYLVGLSYQF